MTAICDTALLKEAQRLGHHQSQQHVLNAALKVYIDKCKRLAVVEAFGSFDFDRDYDYKKAREKH
jgi:hypothetical protein